jgi:hypothetical protein
MIGFKSNGLGLIKEGSNVRPQLLISICPPTVKGTTLLFLGTGHVIFRLQVDDIGKFSASRPLNRSIDQQTFSCLPQTQLPQVVSAPTMDASMGECTGMLTTG